MLLTSLCLLPYLTVALTLVSLLLTAVTFCLRVRTWLMNKIIDNPRGGSPFNCQLKKIIRCIARVYSAICAGLLDRSIRCAECREVTPPPLIHHTAIRSVARSALLHRSPSAAPGVVAAASGRNAAAGLMLSALIGSFNQQLIAVRCIPSVSLCTLRPH